MDEPNPSEKSTALIVHLVAAFLNCCLVGPAFALVMYLVKKDQSKFVAFHSLQAAILQGALFLVCAVTGVLGLVCFIFWFFGFLPWAGGLVYGLIVGMQANKGEWAEYLLVGKLAKDAVLGKTPGPGSPAA